MSHYFEIRNLHVHYGAIHALKGISLYVEEGEIVTLIGANGAGKTTTLRAISGGIEEDLERVYALFPRLKERRRQLAGTLSGGEQQMLAIGRGLMGRPRLLIMDEPSMGLAPILVESIFDTIQEINRQGTTVLLVEQNAHMALSIAHRGYVLRTGEIVLHGTAEELRNNEMVQKTYLGMA